MDLRYDFILPKFHCVGEGRETFPYFLERPCLTTLLIKVFASPLDHIQSPTHAFHCKVEDLHYSGFAKKLLHTDLE